MSGVIPAGDQTKSYKTTIYLLSPSSISGVAWPINKAVSVICFRAQIPASRKKYIICPDAARNRMTNSWKCDWFWWINAVQDPGEEGEAPGILQAQLQDHTLIWETKTTFFCIRRQALTSFQPKSGFTLSTDKHPLSVHFARSRCCKFNSHGQHCSNQLKILNFLRFPPVTAQEPASNWHQNQVWWRKKTNTSQKR